MTINVSGEYMIDELQQPYILLIFQQHVPRQYDIQNLI